MEEEIEVGSVVCLKSDKTVKMTVDAFDNETQKKYCYCKWFHGLEVREGQFNIKSLMLWKESFEG